MYVCMYIYIYIYVYMYILVTPLAGVGARFVFYAGSGPPLRGRRDWPPAPGMTGPRRPGTDLPWATLPTPRRGRTSPGRRCQGPGGDGPPLGHSSPELHH